MKMKNRNFGPLTLALLVCLTLFAACGEADEENNQSDLVNQTDNGTAEAEFTIEIDPLASAIAVTEGTPVVIAFIVENSGDADGTATVNFSLGAHTDQMEIEVAADSEVSGSFTWTTTAGDAGTYSAQVSIGDATDSISVTVTEPQEQPSGAFFELVIDETNSTLEVNEGTPLVIQILVSNTGDTAAILELTGQIALDGGGIANLQIEQQGDAANTPIQPNQGAQIEATLPTGPGEGQLSAGTHTLTISSPHDSASVQLIIN